jgi:hypothetical protein
MAKAFPGLMAHPAVIVRYAEAPITANVLRTKNELHTCREDTLIVSFNFVCFDVLE